MAPPASGGSALRILFAGGAQDDLELVRDALRDHEGELEIAHAGTTAAIDAALAGHSRDVVLIDDGRHGFDTTAALEMVLRHDVTVPVVVICGAIVEERAAQLIRSGASDVVRRDNLRLRLAPAVHHELPAAA